jgi:hypothetical protein
MKTIDIGYDMILTRRKPRIVNKPLVMVAMKLQPLLPICTEAVKVCSGAGLLPSERISIHSSVNPKIKLWLDTTLFKKALVDLLGESAKRLEEGCDIVVSVSSTGMHSSRLNISYTHKKSTAELNDDECSVHYHSSDRTREIVSQHQASLNLRKDGRKVTIEILFP